MKNKMTDLRNHLFEARACGRWWISQMPILVTMGDSKNEKLNRLLETLGGTTLVSSRWRLHPKQEAV